MPLRENKKRSKKAKIDWTAILIDTLIDLAVGILLLLIAKVI